MVQRCLSPAALAPLEPIVNPLSAADEPATLYEHFTRTANRYRDRVALVSSRESMTYGELAAQAEKLAGNLRVRGVGPESRVGLCGERSASLIAAMLGILGAGGAYLPLDPLYPSSRLEYLVGDAQPDFIVIVGNVAPAIIETARKCWVECVTLGELMGEGAPLVHRRVLPDNLAYVIYTSGSTGGPKGNLITHRNVMKLFEGAQPYFEFNADDVWLLLHSFAFDFSVWEIFGALLHGGRLIIPDPTECRDPALLFSLLRRHRVTVLNQTPSFFRLLCDHVVTLEPAEREQSSLAFIIFGGERLDFPALKAWYDAMGSDIVLVNMYGITETTVHVTLYPVAATDATRSDASIIGGPLPHLALHLFDDSMRPVPVGVAGELYVEGAGLARGYHQNPARTAEVFVPNPHCPGARLYRTGDLARMDGDGRLVYLGRTGGFVKVRGFRVSLAEVESGLRHCRGVADAVVLSREEGGNVELDAWVAMRGQRPQLSALRTDLESMLPKFMIPHRFFHVDALPLTVHGKVDCSALSTMDERLFDEGAAAPASPAELAMLSVWVRVLGLDTLGVEDDFFASGGDSMKAVGLVVALGKSGWKVSVQDLVQTGNVRALAKLPHAHTNETSPPLLRSKAASDLQHQMLRQYARHAVQGNGVYHVQQSFRLSSMGEELDLERLERCLMGECAANQSFRTTFVERDGGIARMLHVRPLLEIRHADLSDRVRDAQQQFLLQYANVDVRRPFDLTNTEEPSTRVLLARLSSSTARIVLTTHHAIDDGWGQQQFLGRVLRSYESGKTSPAATNDDPFDAYVARQLTATHDLEAQAFWAAYPLAATCLVPVERPPPPRVDEINHSVSPGLMAQARAAARHARVSTKSLHVANVIHALAAWLQRCEITLGVVVNGRSADLPEALTATGLYWNLQPFSWSVLTTLRSSLDPIHRQLIRQEQFVLYPLSAVLAKQCPGAEFLVTFNYTCFPATDNISSRLGTDEWHGVDRFHYPVNMGLHCDEASEEYRLIMTFDPAYFSRESAAGLLDLIEESLAELRDEVAVEAL